MARLQWDQIAPPQFGDAARILESSLSSFAAGANGISDTLTGIRNRQKNNRSSAAFDVLAGVKSEKDVSGALARVAEMVAPQDRTPELMEAMMNLQQNGMAFDTNRLNQENTRVNMNIAQNRDARDGEIHSRGIAREDDLRALTPAMARDLQGTSNASDSPDWLRYNNQNATRNDPLDPELVNAMSFLGDMGITMDVVSGGQEPEGAGGTRTGSTRHDHGKAADVDFYRDGRKLDWNNPSDLPVLQEIVRNAKSRGVTGIGAGDDYMGAGRFHVGFGDPAVWGAGGKSDNAPSWLVEAYNNAPSGQPAGSNYSFLNQIGEGTMLTPDDLLSMTKSFDDIRTSRATASDENRQRDSEFAATERNRIQMEQATALIEQAARQASTPEEIPAIVAQSGAPAQVQALALNEANSPYVAAQFARPYDPNESGLPGSGEAAQALDITDAMINDVKNTDPTIRIQANAAEFSRDPGVMLAEKLGDTTDDGKGRALDAITTVRKELEAEGIIVSPSEAASLLYESAYTAGWTALAPTGDKWGKVYGDTDAAVDIGKTYLANERKQAGMKLVTEITRAESASRANREALARVDEAIKVQENRKNFTKVDELMAERAKIIDRMVNMEESLGFLPKAETPANAGATNKTPASTDNAPATTAEQAMQQAEMRIAATAIVEGTNGVITLERLAQEPPEMQLQILETVQRTLEQNGDSGAKIQVIEAMKQDIISQMSR